MWHRVGTKYRAVLQLAAGYTLINVLVVGLLLAQQSMDFIAATAAFFLLSAGLALVVPALILCLDRTRGSLVVGGMISALMIILAATNWGLAAGAGTP